MQETAIASWVLFLGAVGIVVGLATFGLRVMATVGRNITELTPSHGFAAELAAASTVVVASATSIPVSTTHMLVGAVLGVGMARRINALDLGVIRTIFMSWIVTLPAGAISAVVFYYILSKGWYRQNRTAYKTHINHGAAAMNGDGLKQTPIQYRD